MTIAFFSDATGSVKGAWCLAPKQKTLPVWGAAKKFKAFKTHMRMNTPEVDSCAFFFDRLLE